MLCQISKPLLAAIGFGGLWEWDSNPIHPSLPVSAICHSPFLFAFPEPFCPLPLIHSTPQHSSSLFCLLSSVSSNTVLVSVLLINKLEPPFTLLKVKQLLFMLFSISLYILCLLLITYQIII